MLISDDEEYYGMPCNMMRVLTEWERIQEKFSPEVFRAAQYMMDETKRYAKKRGFKKVNVVFGTPVDYPNAINHVEKTGDSFEVFYNIDLIKNHSDDYDKLDALVLNAVYQISPEPIRVAIAEDAVVPVLKVALGK